MESFSSTISSQRKPSIFILKAVAEGVGGARGTALPLKGSEGCLYTLTASTWRTGLDPNEQALRYPEKRVLQAALDHGPFLSRGHTQSQDQRPQSPVTAPEPAVHHAPGSSQGTTSLVLRSGRKILIWKRGDLGSSAGSASHLLCDLRQ